jgi:hypothetical protein
MDILRAAGLTWSDLFPDGDSRSRRTMNGSKRKVVATYDYLSEEGEVLYQVVRYDPKDFRQRQPDGKGGWKWNLEGVRKVLFDLPDILAAKKEVPVLVCEGEKDVLCAKRYGFLATTNACGASTWIDEYSEVLCGRRVVVVADNDRAGTEHCDRVTGSLIRHGVRSVRVLSFPWLDKGSDLTDFLTKAKCPRNELITLVRRCKEYVC